MVRPAFVVKEQVPVNPRRRFVSSVNVFYSYKLQINYRLKEQPIFYSGVISLSETLEGNSVNVEIMITLQQLHLRLRLR